MGCPDQTAGPRQNAYLPASQFANARSVLGQLGAPCSSLISNWCDIREMPVLQAFLTLSAAGSLLFSRITLILAKYQGDRFAYDCAHHHPLLCSCIEYRTLAIAPRCQRHVCQILRSARGLYSCNRREWAHFVPRSLHRKFPFLARVSETGWMTGWGVGSSVPSVSTTHTL